MVTVCLAQSLPYAKFSEKQQLVFLVLLTYQQTAVSALGFNLLDSFIAILVSPETITNMFKCCKFYL
jgi:hypothetical protein